MPQPPNQAPTHGGTPLNLAPARWIWFPSRRTLPNTFALFRRELALKQPVKRAAGWVCADSRYTLEVNGERLQFGPAPADPRWLECDPVDLTGRLTVGQNVIGATVLFYGHGDGTSPLGKPGFIFRLEIEFTDGSRAQIVSDDTWQAQVCRAWPPGQHKRWYVRSLQEDFDARAYPYGWSKPGFEPDARWSPAMPLSYAAHKSPTACWYPDHLFDTSGDLEDSGLLERSVPMMHEEIVTPSRLIEAYRLHWHVDPVDYFAFDIPNAVQKGESLLEPGWLVEAPGGSPPRIANDVLTIALEPDQSIAVTWDFPEQFVGWPMIELEASAGTTVELLVHEAHEVGGPVLLNTHFHSWSRFTCADGMNAFEPFDFESFRWVQLVIRNARGVVRIHRVAGRRRTYPFQKPNIRTSDPQLESLISATFNTVYNSLQELPVDGMARERQQYSGDCGHQLHVSRLAFGDTWLSARHFRTYAMGQTLEGYFLDCWPAFDRLVRVFQRQLDLTPWGPILDHAIGFVQDAHHHYLYSGDLGLLKELLPRFERLLGYFERLAGDGLLGVEHIGAPMVWIDHDAYQQQRHKQCAFNLYAAAMLEHALSPIARAVGDDALATRASRFGRLLLERTIARFWDDARGLFVVNKPWLEQEGHPRLCDRSLATAVLYDQCPGGRTQPSLDALEHRPPEMGFSYPANAVWRLWALGHGGRIGAVLEDLRQRWATLPSVALNNTTPEFWTVTPDSHAQWSHCATAPVNVAYANLAGIQPTAPGFARCAIRPQPGDLTRLELTAHTPLGPIQFAVNGASGSRVLELELPAGMETELVLEREESIPLERLPSADSFVRYRLPPGSHFLRLEHL